MDEELRKLLNDAATLSEGLIISERFIRMQSSLLMKGAEDHEACLAMNAAMVLSAEQDDWVKLTYHIAVSHGSMAAAVALSAHFELIATSYAHLQRVCTLYREDWPFDAGYFDHNRLLHNQITARKILSVVYEKTGTKEVLS